MNIYLYYFLSLILVIGIIGGIRLMNSPKTAAKGNRLGALCLFGTVILTLYHNSLLSGYMLIIGILIGGIIGYFMAIKATMLKMPGLVALLNGLGGGASGMVAYALLLQVAGGADVFGDISAVCAMVIGFSTLSGSLVASGKLYNRLSQKPVTLKNHSLLFALSGLLIVALSIIFLAWSRVGIYLGAITALSLLVGILFAIRVGGADMPVAISLLNSLSGLAGAVVGFSVYDPILISVGAIVGAAGLILTKVMCKSMNRSLLGVLTGRGISPGKIVEDGETTELEEEKDDVSIGEIVEQAKTIIIIPGYGMALAQAQGKVKNIFVNFEKKGKDVKFAIHPVAGRMPGHMNVLLAQEDIPYDKLYELDEINDDFENTDLVLIIGANDVVNPAANTAEGTPIYGMPVFNAGRAKNVIVFNKDENPGYSGVPNSLYRMKNVIMELGDAMDTLDILNI